MRTLLFLSAMASGTAFGQWSLHTNGYPWNYLSSTSYTCDAAEYWSYDDAWLWFTDTGEYHWYYEIVHGSAQDAPWTDKFTPLTSMPTERKVYEWQCEIFLGPSEWGKVRIPWIIEDGSETWINNSTYVIAKRDRTWWTLAGQPYFLRWPIL
jgi:hypothetical protein